MTNKNHKTNATAIFENHNGEVLTFPVIWHSDGSIHEGGLSRDDRLFFNGDPLAVKDHKHPNFLKAFIQMDDNRADIQDIKFAPEQRSILAYTDPKLTSTKKLKR